MNHIDPDIARWAINDHIAGELRDAEASRRARIAKAARRSPSLRQRAGGAFIALGEKLGGERTIQARPRLAARA